MGTGTAASGLGGVQDGAGGQGKDWEPDGICAADCGCHFFILRRDGNLHPTGAKRNLPVLIHKGRDLWTLWPAPVPRGPGQAD